MWICEAQCKATRTKRKPPEEPRAIVAFETLPAAYDIHVPSDGGLAVK